MNGPSLRFLDEQLDQEKEYWLQKLSGDLVVTGIPLDYRRPAILDEAKDVVPIEVDQDTQSRLNRICGNNDPLIFTILVAALNICLHKYTGNEDIIVGTTVQRQHKDVASLNKVLALRNVVSGLQSARQSLEDVRRTVFEAYANQKYSFKRLLELLSVEPVSNRAPLFTVVVLLDGIHDKENVCDLKNDITLIFSNAGSALSGAIEFHSGLFKRETLEVFASHYKSVLRTVLDCPDITISDIDLLPTNKKRELIFDFNQTASAYPNHKTIHQLFEEQVARTPDDVAVVLGDSQLSYRELNSLANRLAHYLRKLGAGRGDLIGLYVDHSIEMVVGLLGILKAGGAYVPFDSGHPVSRLSLMLEDAQIGLILTEQRLAGRLPSYGGRILSLDSDREILALESEENPDGGATAEDLAYVLYTSGSTGQPKGVKIQHRALINYIWWAKDVYVQNQEVAFPLYSSLAFDLTVTSIYTPLVTGNRIVIYYWEGTEPRLDDIIKDNQVDILKLTPSHLSMIKDLDNRHSRIKRMIVGGEALETGLSRQVCESFAGDLEIFNEYGPTEATVGCMIHRFDALRDDRTFVPIGRPAANSQIYVLDEGLNPVAENVIGELYISGDGLAEGYLNREDLTAERFITNPFLPGRKMYKTGDLARWLAEGVLQYLGRTDDQVKFHGHRVELNEIKCALNQHPQVRDSVVVRMKDHHGYDVLVAYYVSRQEVDVSELRSFLADRLIQETIPAFFVHLKKMPLTLNGKINSGALPDLNEVKKRIKRNGAAPSTEAETLLARIWSEVLGVERVSIHDNFFDLGGHSLLATQVISRVREAFEVELPLRSLFEAPTIASFAQQVEVTTKPNQHMIAPPIIGVARDGALPLSFAQQRLWFLDQLEPNSFAYNMSIGLRLEGMIDIAALALGLNEVVRRHEALRTTFSAFEGHPVQFIAPALMFSLPVVDLADLPRRKQDIEVSRLSKAEAHAPFDLETGPLLRVKLVRLRDYEHAMFLTMHHIIADGWSMGVLVRELVTLYQSFSAGQLSPLPELPIQYADFAVWQRKWLQGKVLEAQLSYWKRQLAGAPTVMELPIDKPRLENGKAEGVTRSFSISKEISESLNALSKQEGVTLFMTLLAAFKTLLYRSTRKEDIIVGTGIANRNRAETEQLIGFFINMLVLRTDLSGNITFRELLKRVRSVTLEAYAHQDLPFEKLVEELQPERSITHTPWLQVVFQFQNAPVSRIESPGLTLKVIGKGMAVAQFDLRVAMEEGEQGLMGFITYNASLFHPQTIAEMLRCYQILLEQIATKPDLELIDIPLAVEEEEHIFSAFSKDRDEQFVF